MSCQDVDHSAFISIPMINKWLGNYSSLGLVTQTKKNIESKLNFRGIVKQPTVSADGGCLLEHECLVASCGGTCEPPMPHCTEDGNFACYNPWVCTFCPKRIEGYCEG